jgi:hypothetical protein
VSWLSTFTGIISEIFNKRELILAAHMFTDLTMKVSPIKIKDSEGHFISLSKDRVYEVLGIEADTYLILSDPESEPYGNDPVFYDPDFFTVIDPNEPDFWVCQYGEDGERYCYPPEWNEIGFFEDYHDRVPEICERFWNMLKVYYPETWNERKGAANIGFQRTPDGAR